MVEKNCFDVTKLIFQTMRVTVVRWSRSCLHLFARADKPGSTPGDAVFCFLVPFYFSCLVSFVNTIFPFGLFFFILTADAAGHALGSIIF